MFVPEERLELSCLATFDFESSAYTISPLRHIVCKLQAKQSNGLNSLKSLIIVAQNHKLAKYMKVCYYIYTMKWLIALGVPAIFWLVLSFFPVKWGRPTIDTIEKTRARELELIRSAIERSDDVERRDQSGYYTFD